MVKHSDWRWLELAQKKQLQPTSRVVGTELPIDVFQYNLTDLFFFLLVFNPQKNRRNNTSSPKIWHQNLSSPKLDAFILPCCFSEGQRCCRPRCRGCGRAAASFDRAGAGSVDGAQVAGRQRKKWAVFPTHLLMVFQLENGYSNFRWL